MGIALLVLILVLFFGLIYLISGVFWYVRFTKRNQSLQSLANEFGLYFESGLPNFVRFIFRSFIHNMQINRLEGNINGHKIYIMDTFYPAFANLLAVRPFWWPFNNLNQGRRQTVIEIDDKEIRERIDNLLFLVSIGELRGLLRKQSSS